MFKEIIKCTQYDLMKSKAKAGQMYFVVDMRALYKDNGNNIEQRMRFNAVILNTEYERTNNIKPVIGKFYYVEQTNCLWLFDTRWVLKIGDSTEYNTYYAGDLISPVVNVDTSITGPYGDKIIDNNGLLGNGAIVVRDVNRILRATLQSDMVYNKIDIKSYLDNGLLFIPNAHLPYNDLSTSLGALHLTVEKDDNNIYNNLNLKGSAYYYGDWNTYGDMYLIQKNSTFSVYPDYVPLNDLEIIKFYIECEKTVDDVIKKTYIVIRPLSDSMAIVHLISMTDEQTNSVVQNDIGELIFTNHGNLIEDNTFECNRKIIKDFNSYISEYTFDKYDEKIIIKQNKNSASMTIEISENWCDNPDNAVVKVSKWTKDKVLTSSELENPKIYIHRIS